LSERPVISRYAAAFVVLLACQLAYIYNTFPSAEDYRPAEYGDARQTAIRDRRRLPD
jgi:hypothetical protein